MKITVKLFATLADFLPPGTKGNQVEMDFPDGTTVGSIIDTMRLPPKLTHLVLVNGAYIAPEARAGKELVENDQLAIWPPIAGG